MPTFHLIRLLLLSLAFIAAPSLAQTGTLLGRIAEAANPSRVVHPVDVYVIDPVTGQTLLGAALTRNPLLDDGFYRFDVPTGEYKLLFLPLSTDDFVGELYNDIPCDLGNCDTAALGDVITVTEGANFVDVFLDRKLAPPDGPADKALSKEQLAAIVTLLQQRAIPAELPEGIAEVQLAGLPTPDAVARVVTDDGLELLVEPGLTYFNDGELSGYVELSLQGLPQKIVLTSGEVVFLEWRPDGAVRISFTDAAGDTAIFETDTGLDLSRFFASSSAPPSSPAQAQSTLVPRVKEVSVNVVGCAGDIPIERADVFIQKRCRSSDPSTCAGLGNFETQKARHVGNGRYLASFSVPDPAVRDKLQCGGAKEFRASINKACTGYDYAKTSLFAQTRTLPKEQLAAIGAAAARSGVPILVRGGPKLVIATGAAIAALEFSCGVAQFCEIAEGAVNYNYDISASPKDWEATVRVNGKTVASARVVAPMDTSPLSLSVDIGEEIVIEQFVLNPAKPDYDANYTANLDLFCGAGWTGRLTQASTDQSGRPTESFSIRALVQSFQFLRSGGTPRKQDVWDLLLTPPGNSGLSPVRRQLTAIWELPIQSLRIDVSGPGFIDSVNIDCRDSVNSCFDEFEYGKQVELIPNPDASARLLTWGGACAGADVESSCIVEMTDDLTVSAVFFSDDPCAAVGDSLLGQWRVDSFSTCGDAPCNSTYDDLRLETYDEQNRRGTARYYLPDGRSFSAIWYLRNRFGSDGLQYCAYTETGFWTASQIFNELRRDPVSRTTTSFKIYADAPGPPDPDTGEQSDVRFIYSR